MAGYPSTEMAPAIFPAAPSMAAVGTHDYYNPEMHSHHPFNIQDFLQTYYYISMRNYNGYMNYNSHQQMSSDFTAASTPKTAKNNRRDVTGKISKAKKRLLSNDVPLKKDIRNKKRKIAEKLEKECNCRFCYEDHILRMRMQTSATTTPHCAARSARCKN